MDVADILGVKSGGKETAAEKVFNTSTRRQSSTASAGGAKPAKRKGMKREVAALIGKEGMPPLQTTKRAPAFKDRREGQSRTNWIWTTFRNSARTDDSKCFYHWTQAGVDYPDYPFTRFNIQTEAVTFTDDEYQAYLQDGEWSKGDTELLCRLCARYDLRWPVVMDRFPETKPPKAVTQLQQRYYWIKAKLEAVRRGDIKPTVMVGANGQPVANGEAQQVITPEGFNQGIEEQRRKQIELAFKRTKEEEAAESRLREEIKGFDAALKKVKKQTMKSVAVDPRLAKDQMLAMVEEAGGANGAWATGRQPAVITTALEKKVVEARPEPIPGQPYLMSARLTMPSMPPKLSKAMQNKVRQLCTESGIPVRPLPTKAVCDAYDALRRDMVELFSLQKMATQKEAQLNAIKQGIDPSTVVRPAAALPSLGGIVGGGGGSSSAQGHNRGGSHKRKARSLSTLPGGIPLTTAAQTQSPVTANLIGPQGLVGATQIPLTGGATINLSRPPVGNQPAPGVALMRAAPLPLPPGSTGLGDASKRGRSSM